MQILLVSSDLMITSQVAGVADQAGWTLDTAGDEQQAMALCNRQPIDRVVLDLALPGLQPSQLVADLRKLPTPPGRILAFGPHVHTTRLAAARDAGCDMVVSRGELHARLQELLAA